MAVRNGYLIIDIGTGNVRVAVTGASGDLWHVERDTVKYIKDELYPDALYFEPDVLWDQILVLIKKVVQRLPGIIIDAITSSSQREGIVLLDADGKSLIGLSNHDHRGREWENMVTDKHRVYNLTGRYPTSLFSAFKMIGIKKKRPEVYKQCSKMLSISDWALYQLSGIEGYEHSQASETLLYDVAKMNWSTELCAIFGIDQNILPPLHSSGRILGKLLSAYAVSLQISPEAMLIVGGADTQLAIKSTQPSVDDIVIVSGTTTPIVKIVSSYVTDAQERTWTNRHVEPGQFIVEANAGITGLNYQRLKEIFYPNESYEVIEKELAENRQSLCLASLGSLIATERSPVLKGGFIFNTPVSHDLTRSHFVLATLWDIACSIKENLDILCSISGHSPEFIWACGGGFQSNIFRRYIAGLTGKKVLIREGYQQASVTGGALICNESMGRNSFRETKIEEVLPGTGNEAASSYIDWKKLRHALKQNMPEEIL